ncbi:LOW QUALITY PROTEIN: uncharacterized protein LOC128395114 [Panonychus citri]|uniref:LOW QUALITY PROTEIN: uncharacterized protein LOC128395114 n=1 Tax=Panonychus citri TaxID=50023 RepID=UPI0023081390|nr:LOW QUALITY PROTEIN: uncharacterized protein LOC128395114 [Panonychus citri]
MNQEIDKNIIKCSLSTINSSTISSENVLWNQSTDHSNIVYEIYKTDNFQLNQVKLLTSGTMINSCDHQSQQSTDLNTLDHDNGNEINSNRYSILRDADSTVVDNYNYDQTVNHHNSNLTTIYPSSSSSSSSSRSNIINNNQPANHQNDHHQPYNVTKSSPSSSSSSSSTTTSATINETIKRNHQHHTNNLAIDIKSHHHSNHNNHHHQLNQVNQQQQLTHHRSSLRPHSTPATLLWLEENYEIAEGVCIPRSALYMHYVDFCARNCIQPVNAASFGKIIRQQFPQLTTRRLGTRGQSRYHYYGIAVRENSTYYQLAYSKKAITSNLSDSSSRLGDGSNQNGIKNSDQVNSHSLPINTHGNVGNCHPNVNTINTSNNCGNHSAINHNSNGTNSSGNRNRVGTVLPDFPSPNDFKLPPNLDNIKTATFLMMYRTHCQRILDTVIRANFDEIQTFVLYFWQGIPPHLTSILTSNAFINLIGICDSILYKCMASVLLPSALQTFPDSLIQVIRKFIQEFECWLKMALYNLPDSLKSIKIDLSRHLGNLLRRQTSISHLIQAARMVVNNGDVTPQMICDWRSLSIDLIARESIQSSHKNSSVFTNINFDFIRTALRDFGRLLEDESPIEAYFDWLNALVQYCIINTSSNLRYTFKENSKQFLSTWSTFASRIIHELSLNSAPSFGSFHLLRLLFDEYLLYIMEYCQIDEYIMELMANINHDLPPQPLEDNYLGESTDEIVENYQSTNGSDYDVETINHNQNQQQLTDKSNQEFSRLAVIPSDECNYHHPVDYYPNHQGDLPVHHNSNIQTNNQLISEESRKSFTSCSCPEEEEEEIIMTMEQQFHQPVKPIITLVITYLLSMLLISKTIYQLMRFQYLVKNQLHYNQYLQPWGQKIILINNNLTEDIQFPYCTNLKTEVYPEFC